MRLLAGVGRHMRTQVGAKLSANRALLFDPLMSLSFVVPQMGIALEFCVTLSSFESSFASVDFAVLGDVPLLREDEATVGAFVRLLACVVSTVGKQLFLVLERLAADIACEAVSAVVDAFVLVQMPLSTKALIAFIARERPLAGMHQHVLLHVALLRERPAATATFERVFAGVEENVLSKVCGSVESFVAYVTSEPAPFFTLEITQR